MRRLILLLLALAASAQAQDFLAYATFSAAGLTSAVSNTTVNGSTISTQTPTKWSENLGVGVTFNFGNGGPVVFGLDFRGSPRGSNGIAYGMFGFKLTFQPHGARVKPYVQFSVGYVSLGAEETTTYSNYSPIVNGTYTNYYHENDAAFEVLGGVDYPVAHHLDVRILEFGIGNSKEFDILGGAEPSHALFTLNSGLVAHF